MRRDGSTRVIAGAALLVAAHAGCMPSLEQYYPDDAGDGLGAGNACTAFERAEIVAEDPAGPGVLILRGDLVFWLDQETPFGLAKAPKLGGGAATVIIDQSATYSDLSPIFPPGNPPLDLGTDGTLLYWVGATSQAASVILSVDDGGVLHDYAVAAEYPFVMRLAVDANNSYFPFDTAVYKLPNQQGTAPVVLASGTAPLALALAPSDVYFTDTDGTVRKVNKSGTTDPEVIAQDQGSAFGIAADASGAYWTSDGGRVDAMVDGTPLTLASNRNAPTEIAVDEHAVYWVEPNAGDVLCIPKTGGELVTLAADQHGPSDVAIDSTGVYWVNKGGGQVMARYRPGAR